MPPTKFHVSWHFGSGEEAKNRFLRFRIGTILSIFDLQVTPMLPTKFQVSWSFVSGEEAKIDFHDGHIGFWIRMVLAIFDLRCFLPSFESVGLSAPEKKLKTDFHDGRHSGHLGFSQKDCSYF